MPEACATPDASDPSTESPAQGMAHRGGAVRPVFVYGTLRRGESNDITRYRPTPRWVGRASVAGILLDLGAYPGAVLVVEGGGRIVGEVFGVSAEVERRLDRLEGVQEDGQGEYRRRLVSAALERGGTLECLVYEINPAYAAHAPAIAGGDWVRRATQGR